MEQLLYIVFGWLLGLLSPAIVEEIRRRRRKSELESAIKSELHDLQYKMAILVFQVNQRLATLTDARMDWLIAVVRNYKGASPTDNMITGLEGMRKVPEEERCGALKQMRGSNAGMTFVQYSLPFLTVHLSELAMYSIPFQSAVLRIKDQLDMFNQGVTLLQGLHDRTFDQSLSVENRNATVSDLNKGFRAIADQCEFLANAISKVPAVR